MSLRDYESICSNDREQEREGAREREKKGGNLDLCFLNRIKM